MARSTENKSFRSWPLLMLAFGSLLMLMGGSYVITLRGAADLHSTVSRVNETYHANARNIGLVRSGIQATRLLVRDYLLEPTAENSMEMQGRMAEHRARINDHIRELRALDHPQVVARLQTSFDKYCESMAPILEWSADKNISESYRLLRRQVTPRREDVGDVIEEIETLNDEALKANIQRIATAEEHFTASLTRMMIASAALGLFVALASVWRVKVLERRNEQQHRRTQQAEQEMRKLSQQVVRAQEDERRSISRELHDEVGQMLTGLRMELRSLLRMQDASRAEFQGKVEQARTVVEQTLQAIRDIAMGLRPSMLDDLGLDAALRWQAREFCRRHDIAVTVNIDADLANLPDQHRTNLYRIVQEALTNCARHSNARSVLIEMARLNGELRLSVADDGVGLKRTTQTGGLGLIGIQERARELGGALHLQSSITGGTSLIVTVPVGWKESRAESSGVACG